MKHFRSIVYLIALILFPLAVILLAISPIVKTLAIIVGLFNILLYVRELYRNYHDSRCDGILEVWEDDAKMIHQIEFVTPPEKLSKQSRVVLVVRKVKLTAPNEEIPSE